MTSTQVRGICLLSTVKIVDTPIVMAASPNSARTRQPELVKDVGNAARQITQRQQQQHPSRLSLTADQLDQIGIPDRSSIPSISSNSTTRRSSSGRVPWAARMVRFLRGMRWRLSKTKSTDRNSECEYDSSDSAAIAGRMSTDGPELTETSPAYPSLTVTSPDDTAPQIIVDETKEQQTSPCKWSLHVNESLKVGCRRKLSAGAYDTRKTEQLHLVSRKLTAGPSLAPGMFLTKSQDLTTHFTEYVVDVKTSDRFGAGTDANVFLQLFGDKGPSDIFPLAHSNNVNKFERNQLDRFVFCDAPSVGRVQSIKVWHDNSGVGAAWHLAYVEVSDTNLGLLFRFPCHSWLSETGDSLGISRELRCFEVLEGPKKAVQTALGIAKSTRSDSLWALNVKTSRTGSLPVTPVQFRKFSKVPVKPLVLTDLKLEKYQEVPAESVFTPAPTQPSPVIRLPLGDDDEPNISDHNARQLNYQHSNTVPVFPSGTLAEAAKRKVSLDGLQPPYGLSAAVPVCGRRSVYGPKAASPIQNGHMENLRIAADVARHASVSSSTSSLQSEPERTELDKSTDLMTMH